MYESQAYLKYPSSDRPPSPQTDYDESVTAQWDGGENIHDLVNVKRLMHHATMHERSDLESQFQMDLRTRGQIEQASGLTTLLQILSQLTSIQCNHLPPWIKINGESVEEPVRVTYQGKFGKPGLLTCEDRRGRFCRDYWPSMFHCLKCDTYFCRPCGSNLGNGDPKWVARLEEQEFRATCGR